MPQVLWVVTIKVDVLMGVGGFVIDICDNLTIFVFNEDV